MLILYTVVRQDLCHCCTELSRIPTVYKSAFDLYRADFDGNEEYYRHTFVTLTLSKGMGTKPLYITTMPVSLLSIDSALCPPHEITRKCRKLHPHNSCVPKYHAPSIITTQACPSAKQKPDRAALSAVELTSCTKECVYNTVLPQQFCFLFSTGIQL